MKDKIDSSLLSKNIVREVPEEDRVQQTHYLEAVKAFSQLTYESIYVIDYEKMAFEYVSDNPLFLCGHSAAEVLNLGYQFYFQHVPEQDLKLLDQINEAGFDFFKNLPASDKRQYSITYDFHLVNKDGRKILINHKLTPLFLTSDGRMWKAICIVSISHHKNAGHVVIYKQGSEQKWELSLGTSIWHKSIKPQLTKREIEILRLHAQGLTINQIAEKIFVATDTVKYYRRRIFERFGVSNMVEALSYAVSSKQI
ncbi:response regulator transcription factor [Pedobacter insulae]|uniref:Regulatory protein, luxR family n=1 Tax=Pedobacter insulae TaxID=414048 RepID=A0A1I2YE63_9SPHI|nr:helix-turn-helix transcriptional regulator [Pedobacter insulae]SFH23336.1 regulatory protein, luxR family [Pedobacter insulae]